MRIFCMSLCLFVALSFYAETGAAQQLSKKEAKALKKEKKRRIKELKSMKPDQFEQEKEELSSIKEKSTTLEAEVNNLKASVSKKEDQVKQLQNEVKNLKNELEQAKASDSTEQNVPMASDTQFDKGLVFRVQIGAYRNKNLEKFLENSETMIEEKNGAGLQTYTLGNFREYWEADKFKKYLREMGVKDAWIVPYQDGMRVPIKDVLENLQTKKQ